MTPDRLPKSPAGLGDGGRRLWRAVHESFVVDDPAGLALLEQACRVVDVIATAEDAIERDGEYVVGRFGPKVHPAAVVRDRNRALLSALVKQLRLDLPVSTRGPQPVSPYGRKEP